MGQGAFQDVVHMGHRHKSDVVFNNGIHFLQVFSIFFRDKDSFYTVTVSGLPLKQAIPLGLQHVMAMFVGNLTPLLIITGAC